MSKFIQGPPPCTGDTYYVTLKDGSTRYVNYCIQLGWIDDNRKTYNEADFINYKWEAS